MAWQTVDAVISARQLPLTTANNLAFYSVGHRFYIRETASLCVIGCFRPLIQLLHRSLTFPLLVNLSHKRCPAQEHRTRLYVTINYKVMFPLVLCCGVNGTTGLHSQRHDVDLHYCVWFEG